MLNLMLHDRVKGLFLRIEDSGRTTILCDVKASNLTDRSFRCQVAFENNQWPEEEKGLFIGLTTCCPSARSGALARFSAIVLPVTVSTSPLSRPSFSNSFMTA